MAEAQADGPVKVTLQQLGITTGLEFEGQLDYDLGNLTAVDPAPLDTARWTVDADGTAAELARGITQALVSKLFNLPAEPVTGGRLAVLPTPATPLPRALPVPQPKPLTKWQKFALQKGIVKKKRSKLVMDDNTGEYRRRHGYKKANDDNDIPIIEARSTDKPGEDPFELLATEKKQRMKQNRASQVANLKAAAKKGGTAALPASLRLAATLPSEGGGKAGGKGGGKLRRKELKDDIKTASRLAGVSTASIGKFDKRLKGEKDGERAPLGKRRKFGSVTDTGGERSKVASVADKFLRERSDDVVDIRRAMGLMEAAARDDRRAAKGSRGEDGGDGGGGKGGKGRGKGGKGGGGDRRGGDRKGGERKGGERKGGKGKGRKGGDGGDRKGGERKGGGGKGKGRLGVKSGGVSKGGKGGKGRR